MSTAPLTLWSWNVNGLRAATRKGFTGWLAGCGAEVVAVQEVRALPEQLRADARDPAGWWCRVTPAARKGYSGVGLYARRAPDAFHEGMDEARFDVEGRLQTARFGALWVVNVYFPNGSGRDRDHSRVPYKLAFYRALRARLQPLVDEGERALVMGDFNTAPEAIDLARPEQNANKTSGFLDVERDELRAWRAAGWRDTFRCLYPDRAGAYTWWAQRAGCRARNVGWRIDLILASPAALPFLRDAMIAPEVTGSDHCPVGVVLDPAILVG